MLNRNPSNTSNVISSYRKRRQQRGPFLVYGAIALVLIGLILLILWQMGPDQPLSGMFATETATPTLTYTPTNTLPPTSTATITPTPTETLTPTPAAPFSYTVQEGDSLAVIVEKFNLGDDGIKLIILLNPFNPETGGGVDPVTKIVYPGLQLLLPYPGMPLPTATLVPPDLPRGTRIEYVVEPGDTLAGIAARFNSKVEDIATLNKIEDTNDLKVGDILQIPVNLVTPTATLPPTSTPVTPTIPGQPTATETRAPNISVTGTTITRGECTYKESSAFVSDLQALINNERTNNGLIAMSFNQKLTSAAKSHAIDMLCNNYVSHIGLDGSTPETRVAAQGYKASLVIEELFALQPAYGGNARAAFNWWMNHPSHRAELLDPNAADFGIAYVVSEESLFGGYFVVISAKP